MYIIIGGRGRLGSCLAKMTSDPVHIVDKAVYSEFWREDNKNKLLRYLEEKKITHGTILITTGILDPARSVSEHECINYLLPKHIIEEVGNLGFRIITFGTVMENLIGDKTHNSYIISKLKLSNYVEHCSASKVSALHIRLHTLYGGAERPHEFMFLGQLLRAINTKTDFKMTNGEQIREYHHIEDAVRAIFNLAQTNLTGVTQLNHGKPEKLKDIAHHVLNYFEHLSLLRLNALPPPMHENYHAFFERDSRVNDLEFRETLTGIIDYFKPFVNEVAVPTEHHYLKDT